VRDVAILLWKVVSAVIAGIDWSMVSQKNQHHNVILVKIWPRVRVQPKARVGCTLLIGIEEDNE
jgi:hypothetical protein